MFILRQDIIELLDNKCKTYQNDFLGLYGEYWTFHIHVTIDL